MKIIVVVGWKNTGKTTLIEKLIKELHEANHQIELVSENSSLMGHAGCVVRHIDGSVEAASDPRSDGIALAG